VVVFDERTHSGGEGINAERALVEQAKLGSLRECVESLPLEYREVVVMRELEELSYKEISDVAGVPIGTVMSRLSRARKRLQDCMAERLGGSAR
jgi:RNA polymerase sigma-70 factor, ECF subfamily